MNKTTGLRGLQLFVGGALMLVASLSQAQWVWVDAKGVKQFSDRSPPPSVPQKNILKAPRGQATGFDTAVSGQAADKPADAATAAAPAKPSLADRESDYKKRQLEKAEADKKAAAEATAAAAKKTNCDNARAQKAQLDSGVRVSNGADGSIMDDAQRAKESAVARKVLADC